VWELIIMPKKRKKFMYKYPISIGHAFVSSFLDSAFPLQFTHNGGASRWALKFCDRNRRIPREPNLIGRYETRQLEELIRTTRYATIRTIWYATAILKRRQARVKAPLQYMYSTNLDISPVAPHSVFGRGTWFC